MLKVGSKDSKWLALKLSPVLGNKTLFLKTPRKSGLTTGMTRNRSWEIRQGPTPHSQNGGLCSRPSFSSPAQLRYCWWKAHRHEALSNPPLNLLLLGNNHIVLSNKFASWASVSSSMKREHLRGFSETAWVKPSGSLINACFFFLMASEVCQRYFPSDLAVSDLSWKN